MAFLSCTFLTSASAQYSLTVESSTAVHVPGHNVYKFYVNMNDASDKFSAVFGNDQDNLIINTPSGIFNSSFNASWSAAGINPAFLAFFPDMAEDSYATIGLTGPAMGPQADPSLVEDADLSTTISDYFTEGGTGLNVNTLTGGSWYVLNTAANSFPDADLRVLVMQITSSGDVSGTIIFQVFPLGVGADEQQFSVDFDVDALAEEERDGGWDEEDVELGPWREALVAGLARSAHRVGVRAEARLAGSTGARGRARAGCPGRLALQARKGRRGSWASRTLRKK